MKPFLSGRTQAPSGTLQPITGAIPQVPTLRLAAGHKHASATGQGGQQDAAAGPSVECVKQGDKVARLIVTCSCGERIEIECLYPAGG